MIEPWERDWSGISEWGDRPRITPPTIPTLPDDHGRAASHSIASYPSSGSWTNGSHAPGEPNRPRTSWMATAYPRRA